MAAACDHLVRSAPAAEHVEVEMQVANPERLRDDDRLHRVAHPVTRDAVDVRRGQAGVSHRGRDGPQCEGQGADSGVLGELGVADAGDRRPVTQPVPGGHGLNPVHPCRIATEDLFRIDR